MTRDDIIQMTREAGAFPELSETPEKDFDFLRRFAELVASEARTRTWTKQHWTEYEQKIVAAEREEIALMIERSIDLTGLHNWPMWQRFIAELLGTIAELIRGRGQE
jgi:hypothetical protein